MGGEELDPLINLEEMLRTELPMAELGLEGRGWGGVGAGMGWRQDKGKAEKRSDLGALGQTI